jgi:hypothetical protein
LLNGRAARLCCGLTPAPGRRSRREASARRTDRHVFLSPQSRLLALPTRLELRSQANGGVEQRGAGDRALFQRRSPLMTPHVRTT